MDDELSTVSEPEVSESEDSGLDGARCWGCSLGFVLCTLPSVVGVSFEGLCSVSWLATSVRKPRMRLRSSFFSSRLRTPCSERLLDRL